MQSYYRVGSWLWSVVSVGLVACSTATPPASQADLGLADLGLASLCPDVRPSTWGSDLAHYPHSATPPAPVQVWVKHVLTGVPTAVCNDGSPATYYTRTGAGGVSEPGRKRFVIYLEGGGECHDFASCQGRWLSKEGYRYMSNQGPAPATNNQGGILSVQPAENPLWYDANAVFVPYCSSDVWGGDTAAAALTPTCAPVPVGSANAGKCTGALTMPSGTFNGMGQWHYRGRSIIAAMLSQLLSVPENQGGLTDATEVIFSGTSAGGVGTFHNIDDVAAMVQATASHQQQPARIVGIPDAGFFINFPSWVPTLNGGLGGRGPSGTLSDAYAVMASGAAAWGGRGDLSLYNALVAAKDPNPVLASYIEENELSTGQIATPLFIQQSLLDNHQLTHVGVTVQPADGKTVPYDANQQAFVGGVKPQPDAPDSFAATMRRQLELAAPRHAVFSRMDGYHGQINIAFDTSGTASPYMSAAILPTGPTLSNALVSWYLGDICHGSKVFGTTPLW